jgi:hypothetical protein
VSLLARVEKIIGREMKRNNMRRIRVTEIGSS